jgi:hypothetical protein
VKPRENEIEKRVGSQLEKNKIIIIKAKAHHQLLLGEWLVFDSSSVQWDVVQGGWPATSKGNKEQYRQHQRNWLGLHAIPVDSHTHVTRPTHDGRPVSPQFALSCLLKRTRYRLVHFGCRFPFHHSTCVGYVFPSSNSSSSSLIQVKFRVCISIARRHTLK